MAKNEDPLAKSGLHSSWSKDHHTFFSQIKLSPDKTIQAFYDHVNKGMTGPLAPLVKAGRIQLKIVAITFGTGDIMVVWQAKDMDAAKLFRDTILAGNGHQSSTSVCSIGEGNG